MKASEEAAGEVATDKQKSRFMTAFEIAEDMQISEGSAYRLIREMNAKLKELGFITFRGRVNRRYYLKATGAGLDV